MAASSLLALIDDIATILDDVALMTKVAAKKTAGVLGDDLALNAEQVSGVKAARELPVVWSVAKGSFKNKLILVPLALAISAIIPWLITPLLMVGGGYLCFEGFEQIAHKFLNHKSEDTIHQEKKVEALIDPNVDLVALEKEKIKGAIRTDFVLSAEIIVIALGTVKDATFASQITVVSAIAIIMTIGVYGLVAGIVKLDDGGLALIKATSENVWGDFKRWLGNAILWFAPVLMKTLSMVGTAAMFLVGGSIVLHGIPYTHHLLHYVDELVLTIPMLDDALLSTMPILINGFAGVLIGAMLLATVSILSRFKTKTAKFIKPTATEY
jgi:predicted DNA repair protein MutK